MRYKLFFILALMFVYTYGQEVNREKDLKIGLVLSGGGAKGLAHVGVLKVIDSLGLRVDYIAGTSMGAIVGSLYASGYSGKQIDSLFNRVNFDDILSDNLPRAAKTFYERENSEKYAVTLPLDSLKLKLPSALSRGQNTYNLLSKTMFHVGDIKDFDKLPIPFFCIATNIETGEQVLLDKGNLAQAVMASGALPSLFQPVTIGDKVLIDGGVINNYPIDELKQKNVDLIIGVDVQDDLQNREGLSSATDILLQINNFRTVRDMKVKSKKTDVYIKPDIKDFSVVSFNQEKEIIKRGEQAGKSLANQLKDIALMQSKEKRSPIKIIAQDSLQINNVEIEGNNNYTRAYILGKLKIKPNEKISYDAFNDGINNLIATNNFDSFSYDLKQTQYDEGYNLYASVQESSEKAFIKLGLHYDNLYKSALLVNLTKKKLFVKNDVMSIDLILGDNIRYNFEYFIDKGFYWSIGLKSRFNQFHRNIAAEALLTEEEVDMLGVNKIDTELSDFTNQFYLQTLFRKDFALILGAELKHLKINSETIIDNNENEKVFENSDYFSFFGGLKFDTFDNKYFPNEGFLFDGDFHLYLYSSDYNKTFSEYSIAQATIGYAQSFSKQLTATLITEGGFKIGNDSTRYLDFVLGGYGNDFINNFKSFYGYDFITLPGNSFVKATLSLDYEIFKKHHISLAGNFANVEDDLFESGDWFLNPDYTGYALGYSIETFLGPVEAKYTWSPELKDNIWFFNLGFWF
ncbi:MAG TPA: patatin-like phospholipase family protein [Flavobacteriaceae bacterium]|nr:patatin-like phospholipase family protein [Flavobacteriaceae bacterium]